MVTLDTLRPRLRQLKLSGMSEAIGPRAEEARQRGLDPLDFLLLLLDDELARREADNGARRIRAARFEDTCDLRDFDFSYNPELPKAQLWELASGRFIDEHAAVLLCGPEVSELSTASQKVGRVGRKVGIEPVRRAFMSGRPSLLGRNCPPGGEDYNGHSGPT